MQIGTQVVMNFVILRTFPCLAVGCLAHSLQKVSRDQPHEMKLRLGWLDKAGMSRMLLPPKFEQKFESSLQAYRAMMDSFYVLPTLPVCLLCMSRLPSSRQSAIENVLHCNEGKAVPTCISASATFVLCNQTIDP